MIHLIGISGKKQAGKDAVCEIIKMLEFESCADTSEDMYWDYIVKVLERKSKYKEYSEIWTKHSFAYTLKKCICEILGCNMEDLEDEKFKESKIEWLTDDKDEPYTVRRFLQEFGTDVGRRISPMIWCMPLMRKYDEIKREQHPFWIITDVRFECEAEEIKKRGGLLIRINRPSIERKMHEHESETALDNYAHFDEVITNDGSLLDLVEKVSKIREKHTL